MPRCRSPPLFTGVAQADNGAVASNGSNAAVSTIGTSGVCGDDFGNASTTQQQRVGAGASNQSNPAQAEGSAFTAVGQHDSNPAADHTDPW